MIVLKIKFGDDTRRISWEESKLTFVQLNALIRELFPNIKVPIAIKYEDDDKDLVTIGTDMELDEAMNLALNVQKTNVLRLFLHVKDTNFSSTTSTKQEVPASLKSEEKPKMASQPQVPNLGDLFGQFTNNPLLGTLLSNPQILTALPSLLQMFSQFQNLTGQGQSQANNNSKSDGLPDLASLFQNLNLNTSNLQQGTQGLQQFFQQLMNNPAIKDAVPQMLSMFQNVVQTAEQQAKNFFPPGQTSTSTSSTSSSSSSSSCQNNNCSSSTSESDVHYGVVCDGCQSDIRGIRYKCSVCNDYDLCQTCESKGIHDPSHILMKIAKPINYRGCPYNRPWGRSHGCGQNQPRCGFKFGKPSPVGVRHLARFVCDVTIPDGTVVSPDQKFFKIWKMRNEGSTQWPEDARLIFVGGDKLSALEYVPVPAVNPNEEIEIAVDMVAPSKPGRYIGYWRLAQEDGNRFGQRVWIDIVVAAPGNEVEQTASSFEKPLQTPSRMETEMENVVPEPSPVPVPVPVEKIPVEPIPVPVPVEKVPVEPVPVQPEPVLVPPKPVNPLVEQILSMGFENQERIEALLAKNNNDVVRTIQDLLS
jgi:next-to-BRCA1 protein 1